MINFFIEYLIYKKLKKEIFSLKKDYENLKEELQKQKEIIKYVGIEKYELYVVNVCALYFVSRKQILLTSNKYNLQNKTKGRKYRPIVITSIKLPDVKFIALSTFTLNMSNNSTIKTNFEMKNCKFFTENCFLPQINKNSYVFGKVIKRKINGKEEVRIKGVEFSIPVLLLKELEHIEASSKKKTIQEKCEIFDEDYKFIKKCAKCSKEYIKQILEEMQEQK